MTAADKLVIEQPGVYDIPEDLYHADPVPGGSLSASGAKKLLECPARFAYDREHPPQPSASMEMGTAVHKLVLGVGQDIAVVDAKDWRTKKAQEDAEAARAAGKVPLLKAHHEQAQAMAWAVRAHPIAGPLFDPRGGDPERSIFWVDYDTGAWRRARLDWLPRPSGGSRMVIADLKTCESASPAAIRKAVVNYGYHIQAAWYVDAVEAMGLSSMLPAFVLVFVEKAPPHLITVAQLDGDAMDLGRALGMRACEMYRDCAEAGIWPAYASDVALISLPPWADRRYQEDM